MKSAVCAPGAAAVMAAWFIAAAVCALGPGQALAQGSASASLNTPDRTGIQADGIDLGAPELIFQQQDEPELVSPDAASFQFYITDLETRGGPYARGLSELLLGLGSTYHEQGLYTEAIRTFKRGIHVARINTGLNGPEQIPLLKALIDSLIASGDFLEADKRQHHLFRVQTEYYGVDSEAYVHAILERAAWEEQAVGMALEGEVFPRLAKLLDLYNLAANTIAEQQGPYSRDLLPPLVRSLNIRYAIARHAGAARKEMMTSQVSETLFIDPHKPERIILSNFRHGKRDIEAIRGVYRHSEPEDSPLPAQAVVLLGDWNLLHGKLDSAEEAYRQAWDELSTLENGEDEIARHFGTPVLLPVLPGYPRRETPPNDVNGFVDVSYHISSTGRVRDLELLNVEIVKEDTEEEPTRLLRRLKRQQYRPVMVDRELVATETISKRYAY